jgi:uncharacterized iron-regulated membrane protein
MNKQNIKRWFQVHRWSSLICTLFLLIICLTGLPLIFREEILHWIDTDPPIEAQPEGTPRANLDTLVRVAHTRYPTHVVTFLYIDDDKPQVLVHMQPDFNVDFAHDHALYFNAYTGAVIKDAPPQNKQAVRWTDVVFALHTDLFLNLPGELFLGLMGLLFVLAMISGVVLYGPFMKKLNFGVIRRNRSLRLKWLDLHNLLGIAIGIWLLVVGLTGVINELSTPLFGIWRGKEVGGMLMQYKGQGTPKQNELSSAQQAYDLAQRTTGMSAASVVFPGNRFGSPFHYLIWTQGNTPVTSRLFSPVLVDGRTGKLDRVVKMPWYLRSLEMSRPLHFGDYGGLPLKIIWALFDVVAIFVLISGIVLWFSRRKYYADIINDL